MDYQNIIDSFKARALSDREIEQHLSDLMLFYDFAASLNRLADVREIGDLLLLTLMGYAASGRAVFLAMTLDGFEVVATKGITLPKKEIKVTFTRPYPDFHVCSRDQKSEWDRVCNLFGMRLIVPIVQEQRLLGAVGLGEKSNKQEYSEHDLHIILSLVQMSAGEVQSALGRQTLESLNRQLTLKIFQLNTLFELSKDFNAVWEPETIFRILGSSLIGQLLVSRCAVFVFRKNKLALQFVRGFRFGSEIDLPVASLFEKQQTPILCDQIPGDLKEKFCVPNQVHVIFPMILNEEVRGVILLGEKKNERPFTQEDYDFITTITNLALVSDENARMQQEIIEKQRMEKELAIARDIQMSLLPQPIPVLQGYEISSVFDPCYMVGGDYFDFLRLSSEKTGIAIGDVSGKSTPAAMIMASLQASLRAFTSMEITDPQLTITLINQLLCESQSGKYVTFFYGVLNHRTNQLSYVNAGHCYPLIIGRSGEVQRLVTGGTVMGFFKDVKYKSGSCELMPGDLMVLYTDGVSELIDEKEEEFGVDRMISILREHQTEPIAQIQEALVGALQAHRGAQQQWDDITFILLKRE